MSNPDLQTKFEHQKGFKPYSKLHLLPKMNTLAKTSSTGQNGNNGHNFTIYKTITLDKDLSILVVRHKGPNNSVV